jgi:hypothetical protein
MVHHLQPRGDHRSGRALQCAKGPRRQLPLHSHLGFHHATYHVRRADGDPNRSRCRGLCRYEWSP